MSVTAQPSIAREAELRRLKTLYELLYGLTRAAAFEDIYDVSLTSLLDATDADRAAILLFDDDGVIRFKASRGLSIAYQDAVTGHSPWLRGARGARPIAIGDVLSNETLAPYREVLTREGIRALAFVPLALDAGVFGKFMLYYAVPHEFTNGELEIAQAVATHVALATERKRAEFARVHTEQRLQAILDYSPAPISLKDREGRYMFVNRRFAELFQIDETSLLGRTDQEIFPTEIAELFQANDRAVLAAGKPISVEERAPHPDGLHTYICVKFPLEGPDGKVAGVGGIATDITERKQLEFASHRLAAIVESSEDAIVSKDLNGIITSWNKGAERIFGYTAAEIIGQPVATLADPDHLNEMPQILAKIRLGQRVEHYETRRRTKDGRIIDVDLTVSPVHDAHGQIVGASKIARDITHRKQAEQERKELLAREQEARRTAELLNRVGPRLAAQLKLDKLVQEVTDISTTLVGAEFGSFFHNVLNEKGEPYTLCGLSGVSREDFANLSMPRPTDLFSLGFRLEGVVRCDDVTRDASYSENPPQFARPEAHLPVRSYLAVPVIGRSGEVLGGLLFGHSMPGRFTETHEAIVTGIAAQTAIAMDNARLFEQAHWVQTELKRSNEELRRANRDLEVFAYSASHDLQEPLRNIAVSAQVIERSLGGRLQGDTAIFLSNIITAVTRMRVLVDDLLAYTRATKYEEGPAPEVDSGRILAGVLENLKGQIAEAGVTVTTGQLPVVSMHETRLAQLFQNLISNAVKYRSKEAPRVHVAADERDGWCVFSVVDNGIGIEPQFAEQIFGLFKRLHPRDEYPGSGIGLAICQRVVEQYGGRIWLERSEPGKGSTFCFAIPSRR